MKALWALGFCAAGAGQAAAFAGDSQLAKSASARIFSLVDRVPSRAVQLDPSLNPG